MVAGLVNYFFALYAKLLIIMSKNLYLLGGFFVGVVFLGGGLRKFLERVGKFLGGLGEVNWLVGLLHG